nr:hypothetical protein [Acetivibrio ethanolgignens]
MLNEILPSIKDPATNRIVSQTICKLSSLTPEVGSMLILSIKNRKLYERDSSIKQRLAKAKKETKCTITTETETREEKQGKRGERSL